MAAGTEFRVRNLTLENVDTLKYLGQMMYFDNSDWTTIVRNLHRARSKRGRFS